jgi:hypothetical protein
MSNEKFNEIPASACTMAAGKFELGDNGEGAKSAPVKLVARSGQPIEHPYWGKVAHDLSGMHMHKPRLAIDYVHDSKEVIGYLNHFDIETGDLVTGGALVPFKDTDRATEILYKMSEGVPYEASINFGGEGIKVQELSEGEVSEVNGYQFEGPGVIIREWPLRGVAICPYGADMNTESAVAFANDKQVFSASVVSEPEATTEESAEMSTPVDVEAKVEAPVVEEQVQVELEAVEAEAVEAEAEEVEAVEAEPEAEAEEAPAEELSEADPRAELAALTEEFGAEIAVKVFSESGKRKDALAMALAASTVENKSLRERIASGKPDVAPVEFASTDGAAKKTFADALYTKKK